MFDYVLNKAHNYYHMNSDVVYDIFTIIFSSNRIKYMEKICEKYIKKCIILLTPMHYMIS